MKRSRRLLLQAVETIVLTVVIAVTAQTVVAQPFTIKQQSMEHTLAPDEYVIVDKLTPRFLPYQRFDIVVFTPLETTGPTGGPPFVKRVVGVAGDVVEIREGQVFISGGALNEPYVFDGEQTEATGTMTRWVIPPGHLFVLGDHRSLSIDSRAFGPIPVENVLGRVWLRYWPLSDFGVLVRPAP